MPTIAIVFIAIIISGVAYLYLAARKLKNTPMVVESEKIITLTSANYQHQIKNGISLVDFWASWCMPCKMMAPVMNEVANEADGKAKICKVDVQQYQDVSAKFLVRNIPTLILFKDGIEINRFVGVKSKDFLLKEIERVQ